MRIALFGATGTIGTRIMREAVSRGYEVTAVSRHPENLTFAGVGVTSAAGDILLPADVEKAVSGHDAVVSAVGPSAAGEDSRMLVDAIRSLQEGMTRAKVKRLIVVGGAGSLEVAPGKMLMDSAGFPAAWKPLAAAAYEALETLRTVRNLDWSYLSPAGLIEPGERTGAYRVGLERLVTDSSGRSYITVEDYAVALLDELERPMHIRERFTVAY